MARFIITMLFVAITLGLCGCDEFDVTSPVETVTSYTYSADLVSIDLLAARLGLQVDEVNHTHVRLKNHSNTVLIFTHTGGKFYVNGTEIGPVGQIDTLDGKYYVPEALVGRIRSTLGSSPSFSLPPSRPSRVYGTVVIDAGHGGKDPGTQICSAIDEKNLNLKMAKMVASKLNSRGVNVIMTRTGDRFIELEERAAIANRHNADLFVSIHGDSFPDPSRRGYTIYIADAASYKSNLTARMISKRMGQVVSNTIGIKNNNYRVLTHTRGPAVLIEMGHLSNYTEARLLTSYNYQQRLAQAIADGIADALGRI